MLPDYVAAPRIEIYIYFTLKTFYLQKLNFMQKLPSLSESNTKKRVKDADLDLVLFIIYAFSSK